jgi:hypothetical protein
MKGTDSGPSIYGLSNFVNTHRRHFLQQSNYTVCVEFDNHSHEWKFSPHDAVFAKNNKWQDLLWKFMIPATKRITVLKKLDEYNLNAPSLFGSDESLVETLAIREMEFLQR